MCLGNLRDKWRYNVHRANKSKNQGAQPWLLGPHPLGEPERSSLVLLGQHRELPHSETWDCGRGTLPLSLTVLELGTREASMVNRRGKVEAVPDFLFSGSKITADGDGSYEIQRRLLLGRKAMTSLDSILKKERHYFTNKCLSSQSYGFSSKLCVDVRIGL